MGPFTYNEYRSRQNLEKYLRISMPNKNLTVSLTEKNKMWNRYRDCSPIAIRWTESQKNAFSPSFSQITYEFNEELSCPDCRESTEVCRKSSILYHQHPSHGHDHDHECFFQVTSPWPWSGMLWLCFSGDCSKCCTVGSRWLDPNLGVAGLSRKLGHHLLLFFLLLFLPKSLLIWSWLLIANIWWSQVLELINLGIADGKEFEDTLFHK